MLQKLLSKTGLFFLNSLSLLPLSLLYLLADIVYFFLYHVIKYRRKVVQENLRNSFPEKEQAELKDIEQKFYKYLSCLIVEILKMTTITEAELKRRFTFKNLYVLDEYHQKGISTLLCSAHYGNWEWGMLAFGLHTKAEVYTIYKHVSNEAFGDWFNRNRSRFGNHLIPMRQTLRALAESKHRQTIFCFASDQTPLRDESNFWTTFLNQPTAILPGLEKIAVRTNRPVFYMRVHVIKRGYYEVECVPLCLNPAETQPHDITKLHVACLEEIIKEEPAYWLWSHRRWKHKPQD
jgi:KDO2-lipid IV(A) lauroyltransferase